MMLTPATAALVAQSNVRLEGLAQQRVRERRRAERHAKFDTTIRDGLAFSHECSKRKLKPKSSGGARLAYQLERIPR